MAAPNLANGWKTTLTVEITDSATTATVASTSGIPDRPFQAVLLAEGANTDEVVTVTNLSGSTITMTRHSEPNAAGSSSPSAHGAGATIEHVLTKQSLLDLANSVAYYPIPNILNLYHTTANTQNPSLTLPFTPTDGRTILLCWGANGRGINSITQTGVTWTLLHAYNGNGQYVEVWKGLVGAGASTSVTISTSSSNWYEVAFAELANGDLTLGSYVDSTMTSSTPPNAGPVTTTAGRMVVFVASEADGSYQMRAAMSIPFVPLLWSGGTMVASIGYAPGGSVFAYSPTDNGNSNKACFIAELY